MRVHRAGDGNEHGAEDEGHNLVPADVNAHAARSHGVFPNCHKRPPRSGVYNPLFEEHENQDHDKSEKREAELGMKGEAENTQVRDVADAGHSVGNAGSLAQEHVGHIARRDGQQG